MAQKQFNSEYYSDLCALAFVGLDGVAVVGLRVVGSDVGFRIVGALVVDDFSPPPQTQHASFAVTPT